VKETFPQMLNSNCHEHLILMKATILFFKKVTRIKKKDHIELYNIYIYVLTCLLTIRLQILTQYINALTSWMNGGHGFFFRNLQKLYFFP